MRNLLTINSNIENLRIVEKFVDEVYDRYKFSDEVYGNLLIATMEAANNAILHGNKNDISKKVEIKLRKNKNSLQLTVKDEGTGFDYKNIPDPTAPENIEKINGRGIFLMEKLSDKIKFFENGRIVKLSFRIK
jgi:serine/threonine-protein kinase RsbW